MGLGSRGQKGTGSRIPDPQHWDQVPLNCTYVVSNIHSFPADGHHFDNPVYTTYRPLNMNIKPTVMIPPLEQPPAPVS